MVLVDIYSWEYLYKYPFKVELILIMSPFCYFLLNMNGRRTQMYLNIISVLFTKNVTYKVHMATGKTLSDALMNISH